ncbi:MAG: sulfotransferase [Bacteroidota bacterium]
MRFPDFILIGAAKSGTTALFYYLSQHPEVFACPVREPNFFALQDTPAEELPALFSGPGDRETVGRNSVTDLQAYHALFKGAQPGQVVGEVSPLYLYHPDAASNIARQVPQAKLIVVLRNPVARAHASFLHLRRDGREPCTHFGEGLLLEKERRTAGWEHLWHYEAMGRYAAQVERYLALFPRTQLLFLLYDDFVADAPSVLARCFSFLDVDAAFEPDLSRKPNRSGIPRVKPLQQFLSGTSALKKVLVRYLPAQTRGRLVSGVQRLNLARPALEKRIANKLQAAYKEDIEQLQDLIDRDLSAWLTD